MTKEDVWVEYHTSKWIAENGLGRLDPYPESKLDGGAYDGQMECVWNENGILFRDAFYSVSEIAGIHVDRSELDPVIDRLASRTRPGTYNRRPYWEVPSPRHEAHDNYISIAASSQKRAEEISIYALKHGGNINNVSESWLLQQQRQNGELAMYATFAGFVPMPIDWAWLMVGLLLGARSTSASVNQLSWLRLYHLCKAKLQTSWQKVSLMVVAFLWKRIIGKTLEGIFNEYYKPGHPILRMAAFCGKEYGF